MRILMLVLALTGTAHGADIYDERSNRLALCAWRLALCAGDGSIEFRDRQGNRIGRTGPPRGDGSVIVDLSLWAAVACERITQYRKPDSTLYVR